MSTPLPVPAAARALGVSPATVRRYIRQGCPVVQPGRAARGQGALVDPVAVAAWKQRQRFGPLAAEEDASLLERRADVARDFFKHDSGLGGMPAHRVLGIPDAQAAALLVLLERYAAIRITGKEPEDNEYPAALHELERIARANTRTDARDLYASGVTQPKRST